MAAYTPILATLGYIMSPDGSSVLMIHRNTRLDDLHYGKYNGLGGKVDAGEDIVGELQRMLKSWLVHHIKRDDRSYALQLQAKLKRVVEDRAETGWLARSMKRFFA